MVNVRRWAANSVIIYDQTLTEGLRDSFWGNKRILRALMTSFVVLSHDRTLKCYDMAREGHNVENKRQVSIATRSATNS